MYVYFSKLKGFWEEFEDVVPTPSCECDRSKKYVVHLQKLKLFQFLMGLNDFYLQARSHILLIIPLPSVNQSYSTIMSDESQKSVVATTGILGSNPSSGQQAYELALYSRNGGTQKFKKIGIFIVIIAY